jgi:hypothetical protein
MDTKPDVVVVGKSNPPVIFGTTHEPQEKSLNMAQTSPYGQPLQGTQFTKTNSIYGIGPQYQKDI